MFCLAAPAGRPTAPRGHRRALAIANSSVSLKLDPLIARLRFLS